MLGTLFDPTVFEAIGDPDIARKMYMMVTTAATYLQSDKFIFRPTRPNKWKETAVDQILRMEKTLESIFADIEGLKNSLDANTASRKVGLPLVARIRNRKPPNSP